MTDVAQTQAVEQAIEVESVVEAVSESVVGVKPEHKVEPRFEPRPEPRSEPRPEPRPEPKYEPAVDEAFLLLVCEALRSKVSAEAVRHSPDSIATSAYAIGWTAYHVLSQSDPRPITTDEGGRQAFTRLLAAATGGAASGMSQRSPVDIVTMAFSVAQSITRLVIAAAPPQVAAAQPMMAAPTQPMTPAQSSMAPVMQRPMSPSVPQFGAAPTPPFQSNPARPPVAFPQQYPPQAPSTPQYVAPPAPPVAGSQPWAVGAPVPGPTQYGPPRGPMVGLPTTVEQTIPGPNGAKGNFQITATIFEPPAGFVPPDGSQQ